jgi:ATP-dependent DNA ligase
MADHLFLPLELLFRQHQLQPYKIDSLKQDIQYTKCDSSISIAQLKEILKKHDIPFKSSDKKQILCQLVEKLLDKTIIPVDNNKDTIQIPIKKIIQNVIQIEQQSFFDVKKGVMSYKQLRPRQVQQNKDIILSKYINNYYASIKYDGWQAVWDGKSNLSTKTGLNIFPMPELWYKLLPKDIPIAGELIIDGEQASTVASLKKKDSEYWERAKFMVFDLPASKKPFSERTQILKKVIDKQCKKIQNCPIVYIEQHKIESVDALYEFYKKTISSGGEGIVLTKGSSLYVPNSSRTSNRLKLKGRNDMEGRVVGYNLTGDRLKSLIIGLDSGNKFNPS